VACGTSPAFAAVSDPLWRSPRAYVHFAVIDYNATPAVPGLGSAIFIHADMGVPTSGCVALPAARLVRLLRWLQPELAPVIEIRASAS
jgi:L,D-peptidoglycan transpeptidase YkuD (ErfK/YbiS/YcfS/YnhG family)